MKKTDTDARSSVMASSLEYGNLDALENDRIHHVYPTFGREHVTNNRSECWCHPVVEFVEGGAIIIHQVEQ